MCWPTVFFTLSFSLVFKENREVVDLVPGLVTLIINMSGKLRSMLIDGPICHDLVLLTHFYTSNTGARLPITFTDGGKDHYCSVSATMGFIFLFYGSEVVLAIDDSFEN